MDLFTTIITSITLIFTYLIYRFTSNKNNYWSKRGIPSVKGALPIIGNTLPVLKMQKSFIVLFNDFYKNHPNHSMIGYYNFQTPGLIIRDPELFKKILLSNFSNFNKNTSSLDPSLDPLLTKNPFFTQGDEWKTNRTILMTGLSSKKLKVISKQIQSVCVKFTEFLSEQTSGQKTSINFIDVASSFTAEVVAAVAFGIDGESFTKSPGSFGSMAKLIFEPASSDEFIHIIALFFPVVARVLRLRLLPEKLDNYFRSIIKTVLQSRASSYGGDFLAQVCEMCRKEDSDEVDEAAVGTHAASVFLNGYLTSGMTMNFAAYQIAKHPQVQEKLRQEILTVFQSHGGTVSYDALQEMKYMEQVINESMRLFPALGYLGKVCTESIKLVGCDGLECELKPGSEVILCTIAMHRDPRFWENPDDFDPERFGDEQKNKRNKYVFLPFGAGPRICVGMRLAMLQIKAALATLLRDYAIEVDPKTPQPLDVHPLSALFTAPSGNVQLCFRPLGKSQAFN